jgi:AraC-like DNA-binding protein
LNSLTLIIYDKYKQLLNNEFPSASSSQALAQKLLAEWSGIIDGSYSFPEYFSRRLSLPTPSFYLSLKIADLGLRQHKAGLIVALFEMLIICVLLLIAFFCPRFRLMPNNKNVSDWVKLAQAPGQIERIEAFFGGHGYEPHRHDTYAIGRTLSGVQSFHYRGDKRHSLPGGTIVLHPDEVHDGEAGTEEGFRYRMVYIEPALIQKILGGKPLPFIPGGISSDPRLFAAAQPLLRGIDDAFETLEEDALYDLAQTLAVAGGQREQRRVCDYPAAERARAFIHSCFTQNITLDELSMVSGRDRWSLSRDFRTLFGTSPWRYVTMRRLEFCRRRMLVGDSLADIVVQAGFADQSHMTRQFISRFGMSPGRWLRFIRVR